MKVLVGHFTTESNANIVEKNTLKNFEIKFNDEVVERMKIKEVFDEFGIDIIPSIYAGGGPSGVITKETFLYIESKILDTLKKHLHEIDGIYLWLHGASYVDEIGSGDHHIIQCIRKIVGPYLPIAVSCDPHGNLTEDYVNSLQIIRSFRESPHTDMVQTYQRVAKELCILLKHRENIHAQYLKLPLILGGEQSVSTDEPVLSINKLMDEMENDERLRSVSWHVGYLRHDCPEAGCGIVAIPNRQEDELYAKECLIKLKKFIMERYRQFHYSGKTLNQNDAVETAIISLAKPFVITDSGDNTTSGAMGSSTILLNQFFNTQTNKKVLFAGIHDDKLCNMLIKQDDSFIYKGTIGMNNDQWSKPVDIELKSVSKGKVIRVASLGSNEYSLLGNCVLCRCLNHPYDVIVTNHRQSYCHNIQFKFAGIEDWTNYDIVVVKQGYIFPEIKEKCADYVMALTDGATPQDTTNIDFKLIKRPMYPLDKEVL